MTAKMIAASTISFTANNPVAKEQITNRRA
jgi:hypothetical protein